LLHLVLLSACCSFVAAVAAAFLVLALHLVMAGVNAALLSACFSFVAAVASLLYI
jgi:hypothetical protein